MAPQAIVIKTNGNKLPPNIGPAPSAKFVMAGIFISGCKIAIAIARKTIVPSLTKVDK